jgi:hypothetical protein
MAQDSCDFTHVMIDIETLGTRPGSVIASIGAIAFNPFTGDVGPDFSANVDIADAQALGLAIDASTIQWWFRQSTEAKQATFNDGQPLAVALAGLSRFLNAHDQPTIWAHGAGFDPVLLEAGYRVCGLKTPWTHRDVRDTRTIFDLTGVDLASLRLSSDVAHAALSDAIVQARGVVLAYGRLGMRAKTAEVA